MKKILPYFSAMSRLKKWLLSILLLMAMFIFSISAIVATQAGSRWVVLHAAQLASVRLGEIHGNLLTGLDISSLDLEQNELLLHAEAIKFRWQPLALFYTSVSVQSFAAENIQLRLSPAKEKSPDVEPYEWPSLAQPLRVALNNVSLRNIHIQQGEQNIALDNISGSLSLGTFHLRANNFAVTNPQFSVSVNGTMALRYPYDLNVKTHWKFATADNLALEGEAKINGDIEKLKVQHDLTQPVTLATTATISPALHDKKKKPFMELKSEWSEQNIPSSLISDPGIQEKIPFLKSLLTMQGHIQVQGWLNDYQLHGDLHSKTAESELSAKVNVKGVYATNEANQPPLIKWNVEELTLKNQPLVATDNPADNSFLTLKGDVSVSPVLKWDFLLDGEHVNLGQVFADWPTNLQIHVASQGEFKQHQNFSLANGRIAINQLNIQGDVRGLTLVSTGAVDFDGSHWRTSDINVSLGANQLSLKGKAGSDVAVEWKINAPLLNQIDPNIRGSVVSSGLLSTEILNSSASKTNMQMTMQVNQFAWRDYVVANLTSSLKSTTNNNYQLTLNAEHAVIKDQQLSQIVVNGNGNIAQHNLSGTIQAPAYGVLDFSLDSGWSDNQWQGQWKKLSLAIKRIPVWSLSTNTPMKADKTHFELNKLCLSTESHDVPTAQSEAASDSAKSNIISDALKNVVAIATEKSADVKQQPSICTTINWKKETGFTASMNAIAVPLRHASAWLKSDVALDGDLNAQLLFQAPNNNSPSADIHVQTHDAQFVYQFHGGNREIYPIKRGNVDITLKNNQLNSVLEMDWGQYGIINANAKYAVVDKKLQGKITSSLPDLAPLESLLPALDDVHGAATADINVTGSIEKPEFTGSVNLRNGTANVPKLGLELKDISLDIVSQTAGLINLNGQILSGEGRLMLKGVLTNLGAENWHCQGNIFGANISVIKQTQLSATISPNLTFTADAGAINLNGSTEIPWARAAVKALPASATRVSDDVVIVQSNDDYAGQSQQKNHIPFYTNVILYFGDDVHFNGFGLDGRLSGKINVFKEENRQMLTTGFVAVNNGVYKAYGQELSIERGRLIFQGPYENPGLDIRAVRTIEDDASSQGVKAGLDIAGTLQHPKSTVFSIPAVDDSTAMALLVTGKPLDQLKAGDAYALIAAVSSLGVEGGSNITSDISHFFGIDEITIKDDKTLGQNALLIGKNITPRLVVRYVVGLLDQASTLGMSYRLTDKVRVDASSGKRQSLDVIYKIER